jgi:hypothetical protein
MIAEPARGNDGEVAGDLFGVDGVEIVRFAGTTRRDAGGSRTTTRRGVGGR